MPSLMNSLCCSLNSFCCGCSLRTGSKITAVLDIVSCIFGVASSISAILTLRGNGYDESPPPIETTYYLHGINIAVCLLELVFASVMLHGVIKKRAGYLYAWLLFQIIVLTIILIIFGIHIYGISGHGAVMIIAILVALAFGIAIRWYFMAVVYSYYREIK